MCSRWSGEGAQRSKTVLKVYMSWKSKWINLGRKSVKDVKYGATAWLRECMMQASLLGGCSGKVSLCSAPFFYSSLSICSWGWSDSSHRTH